jgi:hypothetical protein
MLESALACLRFQAQCYALATEAGYWNGDAVGISEKSVYEIEVKRSPGDLRADFRNKKSKHHHFLRVCGWSVPNFFYLLVPGDLVDLAVRLCDENNSNYGVMKYRSPDSASSEAIEVVRRARKLHGEPPNERLKTMVLRRMSTELVNLRMDKFAHSLGREHLFNLSERGFFWSAGKPGAWVEFCPPAEGA